MKDGFLLSQNPAKGESPGESWSFQGTMSAEVFVSYSSQDHAQVSKIIERLRKAGVSVWMDEGGMVDAG